MVSATRVCKVCGKEYPYCITLRQITGTFRWQDVACSPEHGSIYLNSVLAARGQAVVQQESNSAESTPDNDESDEYDALFEEDYDFDEDDE